MTYTILSAAFANAEHTAAVLQTQEAGAVLASERDTPDLWAAMQAAVTPAAYVVPEGERLAAIERALQQALDARAIAHGYDSILSACSYAAQPQGSPFQAEGAAFLAWRSAVWAQAYVVMAEVQAGRAALPGPDEAVASMPALTLQ